MEGTWSNTGSSFQAQEFGIKSRRYRVLDFETTHRLVEIELVCTCPRNRGTAVEYDRLKCVQSEEAE